MRRLAGCSLCLVCRPICRSLSKSSLVSNPNLTKLGRIIRVHREKAGYSQESFADKCGVHRTYIGAIERGERNITLRTLFILSDALGIKPSFVLMELDDEKY